MVIAALLGEKLVHLGSSKAQRIEGATHSAAALMSQASVLLQKARSTRHQAEAIILEPSENQAVDERRGSKEADHRSTHRSSASATTTTTVSSEVMPLPKNVSKIQMRHGSSSPPADEVRKGYVVSQPSQGVYYPVTGFVHTLGKPNHINLSLANKLQLKVLKLRGTDPRKVHCVSGEITYKIVGRLEKVQWMPDYYRQPFELDFLVYESMKAQIFLGKDFIQMEAQAKKHGAVSS